MAVVSRPASSQTKGSSCLQHNERKRTFRSLNGESLLTNTSEFYYGDSQLLFESVVCNKFDSYHLFTVREVHAPNHYLNMHF